jgi:hypothetical protein
MFARKVPLTETFEQFITLLPPQKQTAARRLLYLLQPTVDIQDRIVYSDGIIGSNVADLLLYYFDPENFAKPHDFAKFEDLISTKPPRIRKNWMHLY